MSVRQEQSGEVGKNLARLGLGLLLLGLVFLFRHSIEQGWIGPEARIALGGLIGLVMVATGALVPHRPVFARLLQGGGVAALYLTAFASHRVYGMLGTTTALVVLAAISSLGVGLALREQEESLAVVGLLGALAAPGLIGSRIEGPLGDVAYIGLVMLLGAGLYWFRPWYATLLTAAVGGWSLLAWQVWESTTNQAVIFGVVNGYLATFLVPLVVSCRRTDQSRPAVSAAVLASAVVPVVSVVLMVAGTDFDHRHLGLVALSLAAIHLALRPGIPRLGGAAAVADTQLIPAVTLAGFAAVLTLEGDILLLALASLGIGMVVGGSRTRLEPLTVLGHMLYIVSAAILLAATLGTAPSAPPIVNEPALVRLAVLSLAAAAGWLIAGGDDLDQTMAKAYRATAYVGLLGWFGHEFSVLANGQGYVTIAWGAVAIVTTIAGRTSGRPGLMRVGLATLLVAVGKLFIVDLAIVDPIWRILLFIGFGAGLLAVAFWLNSDTEEKKNRPLLPSAPSGK
jgi:uncharacterized membrane protein